MSCIEITQRNSFFYLFSVQSSAEKAAQDLFQMFEAVREDETNNNNKQPK